MCYAFLMTEDEIKEFIRIHESHPLHESALNNNLDDFIKLEKNETFSDMLFRLIREKNLNECEVYKRAGITAQHFSKIRSRSGYQPTKSTVLALALALRLDLSETKDLMRTAGLAFTHASTTDMVVEYYIINCNWDLFQINETLDSLSQNPLP